MTGSGKQVRESSIGWLLQRLAAKSEKLMEENLSQHGLTIQQFAVLITVLEAEGQTQAEIGQQFSMPAYAISRALDKLSSGGFVARKPHPTSRRAFIIFPTEKAQLLAPELYEAISQTNKTLTAPLSASDRTVLQKLLMAIL